MNTFYYRTVGRIILREEDRKTEQIIIPISNVEKATVACWSHKATDFGWDSSNFSNPFLIGVRPHSYGITLTAQMAFAFTYPCIVHVCVTILGQRLLHNK